MSRSIQDTARRMESSSSWTILDPFVPRTFELCILRSLLSSSGYDDSSSTDGE